jgi:hypothetical protein
MLPVKFRSVTPVGLSPALKVTTPVASMYVTQEGKACSPGTRVAVGLVLEEPRLRNSCGSVSNFTLSRQN